jgi:hypothetical protein
VETVEDAQPSTMVEETNEEKNTGRKLFGDLGTPSYRVLFGADSGHSEKAACDVAVGVLVSQKHVLELPRLLENLMSSVSSSGNVSFVVHLSNDASGEGKVIDYLLRREGVVTVLEHEEGSSKADSERLGYLHLLQALELNNCSYQLVFRSSLYPAKDFLRKALDFLTLFQSRTDWGYLTFVSGSRKNGFAVDISTQQTFEDNSASVGAVLYRLSVVSALRRVLQSSEKGLFVSQIVMSQVMGKMRLKVFERTPNLFQNIVMEPSTANMAARKENDPREDWFSESFEYNEDNFTSHAIQNSTKDGYLGCYSDQLGRLNRDLNGKVEYRTYYASVKRCRQFCASYMYFGLQDGLECYCGNEFGRYGNVPDEECSKQCAKDSNAICGGALKNSVYRTWPYQGKFVSCYHSKFLNRWTNPPSNVKSIDDCASRCEFKPYFGITEGRSCYCLDDTNVDDESIRLSHSYCNMRCHGNPTHLCGSRTSVAIFSNSL